MLRVRLGIDEVVTTLLLNPVALLVVKALVQGPWRDPGGITESPPIAAAAEFPQLIAKSRLHLGFILALVILVIAWYVLSRTATGLRLRAVGLAPHAARFAGIKVERSLLRVALVSGAIAGIAGVSEVAGIQGRLTSGLSSGFGYTGIVVAMLGGLSMPGVLISALLLGDLNVGTNSAERALDIPSQMGDVVQGTLLLVVVGLLADPALARHPLRPPGRRGGAGARGRGAHRGGRRMNWLFDLLGATLRNATPWSTARPARPSPSAPASSTWASRARCTSGPSRGSRSRSGPASRWWGCSRRSSRGSRRVP